MRVFFWNLDIFEKKIKIEDLYLSWDKIRVTNGNNGVTNGNNGVTNGNNGVTNGNIGVTFLDSIFAWYRIFFEFFRRCKC